MTFLSFATLIKWLQVVCAGAVILLILFQVFRSRSNARPVSTRFLRHITLGLFLLLAGGAAFAKYYVSTAPQRLASVARTDPKAAINGYTAAIRLSPQTSDLYFRRAMNRMRLQQYSEAVSDFSRAVEQSPNNPRFLINRAFAYVLLSNYRAADSDVDNILRIGYRSPEISMLQGVLAAVKGQYKDAKNYYTQALAGKLDPKNHCYALIDRSYVSVLTQDYTSALADLSTGLNDCKSKVDHEDLLVNRGVVYKLMNLP